MYSEFYVSNRKEIEETRKNHLKKLIDEKIDNMSIDDVERMYIFISRYKDFEGFFNTIKLIVNNRTWV